jgi:hypothetical protein
MSFFFLHLGHISKRPLGLTMRNMIIEMNEVDRIRNTHMAGLSIPRFRASLKTKMDIGI